MFLLSADGHKIVFIYEKDTGSETTGKLAAKLFCYYQWYKKGLHKKTFETNHIRVLVETHSQKRLENLINTVALPIKKSKGSGVGSGIFWFTTESNINLENPEIILKSIWTIGQAKYLLQKHSMIEII